MCFVVNLPGFAAVKKFWKSVKNWQSYRHEFGVLLFLGHSVLLVWKNKCPPRGKAQITLCTATLNNSILLVSISTLTVNGISFCTGIPTFIKMGNRRRSYDVISIFKMAAATELFFTSGFGSGFGWRLCHEKVQCLYHPTKYRRNNSIGGCDITTSVSEKQKSTTLELRFQDWTSTPSPLSAFHYA